jgi:3-dehydroquinate synthase
MEQVIIKTSANTYPVYIGNQILSDADRLLKNLLDKTSNVLIVTDDQVGPLYLEVLKKSLSNSNVSIFDYIVPRGEASKSFDQYYQILSFALESGLDRTSAVIALGGGVIGDLAGFVAATYMRGIKFIQIPTSLLAHDSSVGGKVGINHELGKNMIGAFYQPHAVLYDVAILQSLSDREWASGFAEVIKHGLISGEQLHAWLQSSVHELPITNETLLINMLKEAILVKARIVEEDEKEAGVRAYLNLGHTLGHAIEATYGYGKITHGEAVAIGILFAIKLSNEILGAKLPFNEIREWFLKLSLPVSIPEQCDLSQLINYMKRDKKNENGNVHMILLEELGKPTKLFVKDEIIRNSLHVFNNK